MFLNICSMNQTSDFVHSCSEVRYSLQDEFFFFVRTHRYQKCFCLTWAWHWYHLSAESPPKVLERNDNDSMKIGWLNTHFNYLLKCEKENIMVAPQHFSADIAKSWQGWDMLCKLLQFIDAQKSLFAAHPHGKHCVHVSIGNFVLILLRCIEDS